LSEFQSPSRRIFIGSHSLPPLWSPNRSFIKASQALLSTEPLNALSHQGCHEQGSNPFHADSLTSPRNPPLVLCRHYHPCTTFPTTVHALIAHYAEWLGSFPKCCATCSRPSPMLCPSRGHGNTLERCTNPSTTGMAW
jgi:hypothetical protein